MVLDFLKRLFGSPDMDPYERQVLEREHREVVRELRAKKKLSRKVPTGKSKKKMSPQAKAVVEQIDRLKKRKRKLEKKLGGVPEDPAAGKSKRSRR